MRNAFARAARPLVVTALAVLVTVALSAHEVTYKGSAVALKTATYAQPNGPAREVQELEVTIVDAKTKKPSNKVFTITDKTRVLRAGKPIAVKDATVQKGDAVSVVVDHDKPGDEAIEVRLPAAK